MNAPLSSRTIPAFNLDLATLRSVNLARQDEWKAGGDVGPVGGLYRANELGGEVGEAQNVVKKLERERRGWRGSRSTVAELGAELGDVVICADLLAAEYGIDLSAAVVEKFNATSEKVGLATRITSGQAVQGPFGQLGDVLEQALAFAEDELENRECGGPDVADYISEARVIVEALRNALQQDRADAVREIAAASVKRIPAVTNAPRLIGLAGLKGSGKDTAASALDGYENVKMAGPLKAMLRTLLKYQGVDLGTIDRMIDGDLKEEPTPFLAGQSPRYAMQTLGTEWGRQIMADDIWIRMAEARAGLFDSVVITDIRFPNEAEMVKRLGGVLVRVERDGLVAQEHASEALVASLPADAVLVNDADTAETFAEDAASFFEGLAR